MHFLNRLNALKIFFWTCRIFFTLTFFLSFLNYKLLNSKRGKSWLKMSSPLPIEWFEVAILEGFYTLYPHPGSEKGIDLWHRLSYCAC
jgi:hypothetical protein